MEEGRGRRQRVRGKSKGKRGGRLKGIDKRERGKGRRKKKRGGR
jgi:hypothetical protein